MTNQSDKLDMKAVSNNELYTFRAEETPENRAKRLANVEADIADRFAMINEFLGRPAPANVMEADTRYNINPMLNKVETIKQLLYVDGPIVPQDYEDMYNIVADNSISNLDRDKEKILATDQALMLQRNAKIRKPAGIIVPGKN